MDSPETAESLVSPRSSRVSRENRVCPESLDCLVLRDPLDCVVTLVWRDRRETAVPLAPWVCVVWMVALERRETVD